MLIYLDQNATSPMHAPVIGAMMPFLNNPPACPSSLHGYGRRGDTDKLAGIVAPGKAARFARLEIAESKLHLEKLRDPCETRSSRIFGQQVPRIPNANSFRAALLPSRIPVDVDGLSTVVRRVAV